jgi:hypothetical protein
MAYSCPAHFSDQFSYIKHFISSYGLRDMIFARSEQKQKKGRAGPDLHCPGPDLICVGDGNFGPRGR